MTDEATTGGIDWIDRAGAAAKGKRPAYFDDPATDRLLSIVMALAGELSVVRERLDTVERLLDAKGVLDRADIEAFRPDRATAHDRGVATRAYIARILRGVQQDMEAMGRDEPSVEDVSRQLRDS